MVAKIKPEVENWIKGLSDEDMPGFASTVTDVTAEIDSDDTSAVDVARSVLKDPALTSRLLKMANSFRYNHSSQKISTVSRAIMVLGFEKVRSLTISLVLVDSLQAGQQRNKLTAEIAQSFHAAIQAQELASKVGYDAPENVFIAALLARLGHMAFWAFAGDKASEVLALVNTQQMDEEAAQLAVLNFSLQELSQGLTRSWSLGELLEQTHLEKNSETLAVNLIQLSHELANNCTEGWESEAVNDVLLKMETKFSIPIKELRTFVEANAKLASEITQLYGVSEAIRVIPQPGDDKTEQSIILEGVLNESETEYSTYPDPDPQLQVTILQDMAAAFEEKPNINIILEMVLEGLHRGIGMDRALFAILSKDRKQLICKYALGESNERLSQQFQIDISRNNRLFERVVSDKKASHISVEATSTKGNLSSKTSGLLGNPPYLVMPTVVRGKVIGLFIADRNASGREITDNDFISFQQFCKQANMGLTFLTMQG